MATLDRRQLLERVAELTQENRHLRRERRMLELDLLACPKLDPPSTLIGDRAKLALAAADGEWRLPVQEPPGENWTRIDRYIRMLDAMAWDWLDPYREDGQSAWCGAFAAFCWGVAGLKFDLRRSVLPSCRRVRAWLDDHPDREVRLSDLAAGDVLVVGREGSRRGQHIALVWEPVATLTSGIATVEGNALGRGPDGADYEGVVRQVRPLAHEVTRPSTYRALYALRWREEDFER